MSDQPETDDPNGALRERLAAALTDAATEVRQKYHVIPDLGSAPAGVTIQGDVDQLVDGMLTAVQPQLAALDRVHRLADLIAAGAPWAANRDDLARRIREAASTDSGQAATEGRETPVDSEEKTG